MLKNIAKLEAKINEKFHQYICDNDTPTSDIKEFCYQVLKFVGQIEDHAKSQQNIKDSCECSDKCDIEEEKITE